MRRYSAENIDLFAGDLFELSGERLGPVDAVYDRAALVALPKEMRIQYAAHLKAITDRAPQFLVTYRYDQSRLDGPPFSISAEEVERHYQDVYNVERQASVKLLGGLKGVPGQRGSLVLATRLRWHHTALQVTSLAAVCTP